MKAEVKISKDLIPMGVRRRVADAVGKMYLKIIRDRTARGKFGKGSRPYGARRNKWGKILGSVTNYNEDYARRKGVSIRPVTLSDTGEMLGSMRAGVTFRGSDITVGIIWDNRSAEKRFEYHQILGAGTSRIIRKFVYHTQQDRRRLMREAMRVLRMSL